MAYLLNKNTMSKIVKKKDLDVLIESTMSKAGIKKPIIKEDLTKLTKGLAAASVVGAVVYTAYVSPNQISVTTKDGQEYTANKGDSFTGKVKSIKNRGSRVTYGTDVVLITSNGDTVEFYTEEPIEFNIGDTIKVTAESTFRMFDRGSNVKNMEESTSSEKSLIKEDLDKFNKLINYTFKK